MQLRLALSAAFALVATLVTSEAAAVAAGAEAAPRWRWRELTPEAGGEAPAPRRNGSAIWDRLGRRIVIFGGTGDGGLLADVWAFGLDQRAWTRIQTTGTGPAPRLGHDAVYDPIGRRMIVWGGQGSGFYNDAFALDLATGAWTQLQAPGAPRPRYGTAAVYDPVARSLVTFGGFTDAGRFQDTHALSLDTPAWADLAPAGALPVERCLHTAALQRVGRRMILYGGQRSGPLDDLWAFDLAGRTWTQLVGADPPAGRFFANSFVGGDGRFYVVFGNTNAGNVNEVHSYDFLAQRWTRLDLPGAPAARNGAMAAYVEDEDRLVVFGGTGAGLQGDVWELAAEGEPVAETWILPSAARAPGAGGAFFTTGLTMANTGFTASTVTLKFLGHDQDGRTGPERTLVVPPGQAITHRDLLALFDVAEGFGAVRITSNSPALVVLSQTSTPASSGGTFGQSVAPVRLGEAVTAGAARTIAFVREDAAFRTNLILANAGELELPVDVALIAPGGATLGSRRVTLPPLGMTQISRVVRELGVAADVEDGRLVVSTGAAQGAFFAYAALIDNATNDPRTLLPR